MSGPTQRCQRGDRRGQRYRRGLLPRSLPPAAATIVAVVDRDLARRASRGGGVRRARLWRPMSATRPALDGLRGGDRARDAGRSRCSSTAPASSRCRQRPHDLPMAAWDDVVRVDQRGTYVACLVFATAHGRSAGAAAIVNIASIAGMRSMPLHAYAPGQGGRDRDHRMPRRGMGTLRRPGQRGVARLHAARRP